MWTFWKTQYYKDIHCLLERNNETLIVDFSLELDKPTLVEQEQHRKTSFTRY